MKISISQTMRNELHSPWFVGNTPLLWKFVTNAINTGKPEANEGGIIMTPHVGDTLKRCS